MSVPALKEFMATAPVPKPPQIPDPSGSTPLTHHEWRTASNSATHLLKALHALRDARPDVKLLDVGCGSGSITATLALEIPQGLVTGVDKDPEILKRAELVARSWEAENVTFQTGDASKLPFPDNSFDIVHCHQVLTWQKEPWVALAEMLRVTKPGGIVSAREGDFRTEAVWPETEGLKKFHDFTEKLMKTSGGHSDGGRQLLGWALKAGAKREDMRVTWGSWGYSSTEEKKAWSDGMVGMLQGGRLRGMALKMGLATEDDLDIMIKAWNEWFQSEEATLSMMSGEILIQK
ncbi:unnamed protein product [Clonostachys rosea f. rosea IK726]|uniref:Uncharacterized protein n=2 Tax=Bionectria ochroleuca TaxID=29856 RepID=A0ACA9U974_BIOOC|nr:unnamed protein product [Clonostachys rosea f. rosea IK726]